MNMNIDLKKTGVHHIIRVHGHLICILLFALSLLFMSSCSKSGGSEEATSNGSVAFALKFPEGTSSHLQHTPVINSAVVSSACAAYGVSTIEAYIYDGSGTLIAQGGPWNCIDGSGLISEVTVGENRRIVVLCYNEAGVPIYSGERTGVLVALGATTDAGVIDVSSTNHAPELAGIADTQGLVSSPVIFDSSEFFATDADDDILTYEIGNLPAFNAFDPENRLFSWTPGSAGDYKVLFVVHDDGTPRKSDYQEVTINVGSPAGGFPPRHPVLYPIGPQVVSQGSIVSIQLQGTDPDEGIFYYSAEPVPGKEDSFPETYDFEASGAFTWDTASVTAGNYSVLFRVSNTFLLDDFEEVTITVGNVNRPPVLTPIGSRWRTADNIEPISFIVTASDPEDDILTYSLVDLDGEYSYPTGASIDPGTQVFTWSEYAMEQTYQVRIVVTDSHGETDFEDVLIRIPAF